MIKKSFRLMLLGAFALLSSVFVACDKYDDDIEGLQAQIDALKATVQSLQSEIDGGAVITNVAESSTGVTVTLSNGKSFTISNGTDGEDGAAGKSTVVEIGENGNWYIDGEDTGIAAAGKDGDDGEDGQPGSVVEIGENGNWFIDGEDTGVSAAGTEGGITAVFENGVLTLYGVEGLEDGYVIGAASHIASLAVVPEKLLEGLGLPLYENYVIFDKEGEFVASNNFEVTYRVNPTNANVDSVEFSFLNRFAEIVRAAEADETDAVEFVSVAKSENIPGAIDVTAKLSDSFVPVKFNVDDRQESLELNLFALKAANVDGCEIVSDYAVVFPRELDSIELVNIYACEEGYHHVLTVDSCANVYDAADSHRDAYMYYDGTLDLNEVVSLFELDYLEDAIANYGFDVEYTFSDEKVFKGQDGKTDQNKFVKLDGSVLSVDKEFLKANPQGGRAAIGRTPLIFVEAKIAGVVIDTASIKIEITEKEVVIVRDSITITVGPESFEYSDIVEDSVVMALPWEQFNQEVYEVLGLDAQTFWDTYGDWDIESEPGVEVIYEYPGYDQAPTSTDIAGLAFDPYEVQLGDGVATLKLISDDPRYKDVLIKFVYNIYHNPKFPALNPDYLLEKKQAVDTNEYEVVRVKGKLIDGVWALQSEMKEFCENYLEGYVQPGNHNALKFRIEGLVKDGALITDTAKFGACLVDADGANIALDKAGDQNVDIKLTTPLGADEPSRVYLIRMSQFMYNGQRCVKYFCVEFVRPFDMTIDNLTLKTLIAKPDSVCVDSAVVIKDLDGKVIYEKCDVTEYAQEVYNFSKDNFEFTYDLSELDSTWGDEGNKKLTLVTDEEGNTYIRWYNGGGELQNNKYLMPEDEEFNVTVSVENLAAQEVFPKVTVLSSANSK